MMNEGWEVVQGVEVESTQRWPVRGTNTVDADDVRLKDVDQTPRGESKDRIETERERVRAGPRCKFENESTVKEMGEVVIRPREKPIGCRSLGQ
jgi:hypothetical protein